MSVQERDRELILVADDDEDIVRFVEINLRLEGFEVATASDGEEALQIACDDLPELVLLDVMMPKIDGFEVCQRLRSDARTKGISVIMLTAKSLSADRVLGLTMGADDYIIKPFDPTELVARVKSAMRRTKQMRDINPLTQLPGNVQIQAEVQRRVESGSPFALMHADLDNFKPFNDHYGFLRGDGAIQLLASTIDNCVLRAVGDSSFVGHIGGDDFVVLMGPDVVETVAKDICEEWDRRLASLYDSEDFERGYIEIEDRRKEIHRFPLATVSIGIATNRRRPIQSHWEAAEIAGEMKSFAKRVDESRYAIDRRGPTDTQSDYDTGDSPARPDSP
ncbi:MAG: response regulator [Actinomycetota bacterium]|nr:response regulator [Actinomycetota bacterium]